MALIPYPTNGYNTFATVPDITLIIERLFIEKAVEWNALGILKQTSIAEQTFMYIMTCPKLKIPPDYSDTVKEAFTTAQAFLCLNWMDKDLFSIDLDARAVTKEKVGDLEVDYDVRFKASTDEQHPYFYRILSPYGCSASSGFSQSGTVKA